MPDDKVTTTNGDVDVQPPEALHERPAEPQADPQPEEEPHDPPAALDERPAGPQDEPQPEEEPHDPPTEDSGENSTETHSAGASVSDAVASNPDSVVEGTL